MHCISAFFIYGFWWHKPYNVARPVYIGSVELHYVSLLRRAAEE